MPDDGPRAGRARARAASSAWASRARESSMIRTYLDWLLAVPWSKRSEERLDPVHARAVLDDDHAGLDDVKKRITEYLAVRKLRAERGVPDDVRSGVILTLIGPPGTGKTSIGESIARATGRKFVRMSLGGVRDEAEIRGHRRTYIGALPGRLVRALRDAGTMNPVILLDEVDKIGADWRGDPVVGAARGARPGAEPLVPRPLPRRRARPLAGALHRDRQRRRHHPRSAARPHGGDPLRRLHASTEKVAIARGYLWPRQVERNGLRPDEVDDRRRRAAARHRRLHARGGRAAARARARHAAPQDRDRDRVGAADAAGRHRRARRCARRSAAPKFFQEAASRTAVPGRGDRPRRHRRRRRRAVRRGRGDAGLRRARPHRPARRRHEGVGAHRAHLGAQPRRGARHRRQAFRRREFHVHVPAGAIPKDGPSAGVTHGDRARVAPDGSAGASTRSA